MEDSNREEDVVKGQTSEGQNSEEAVLAKVNKTLEESGLQGTFKDLDSAVKSIVHAKKLASEKGQEKKEEPKSDIDPAPKDTQAELLERLYRKQEPQIDLVWDDLQEAAKNTGKSVFELYESGNYFKNLAGARAEEEKQKENEAKLSKPSEKASESLDVSNVKTKADFDKLSASEQADFIMKKASQG